MLRAVRRAASRAHGAGRRAASTWGRTQLSPHARNVSVSDSVRDCVRPGPVARTSPARGAVARMTTVGRICCLLAAIAMMTACGGKQGTEPDASTGGSQDDASEGSSGGGSGGSGGSGCGCNLMAVPRTVDSVCAPQIASLTVCYPVQSDPSCEPVVCAWSVELPCDAGVNDGSLDSGRYSCVDLCNAAAPPSLAPLRDAAACTWLALDGGTGIAAKCGSCGS